MAGPEMTTALLRGVALLLSVTLALAAHAQVPQRPQRIVSLVPAVTEMLFAIGAGDLVVGVSSFDKYPDEVKTRPRVGALVDPDVERILALRPDMVVHYATQDDLRAQLSRAGIASHVYRHDGLADIPATMRRLGAATGRGATAERAAADFERRVAAVRARVAGRPRPRTLLVFGRDPSSLRNVYASGGTGFLHDVLVAAGGDNVFADVARESVQASTELILARAPAVIVELRTSELVGGADAGTGPWRRLASVPAVRDGRVHALSGDYLVVPGPRMAAAVEALSGVLHPQ